MSATVKLSSRLPGDEEINGLDHLALLLTNDPESTILCGIVWLDVAKVTYDVATETHVPTVQVRRIEAFPIDKTPQSVRETAARLYEERRGQTPLPFDALDSDLVHVTVTPGMDAEAYEDEA